MSDDTGNVATIDEESSAERLLAIGEETRKRGRPKGSKNKPSDGESKISQTNQRTIFKGAIIALFSLLAIMLSWAGYEQVEPLTDSEAEEGGTFLLPISQRIGWVAAAAFYLSFPAWLIIQINRKFRKRPETAVEAPRTEIPGVSPSTPGNTSPDATRQSGNGAPVPGGAAGFSPEPLEG